MEYLQHFSKLKLNFFLLSVLKSTVNDSSTKFSEENYQHVEHNGAVNIEAQSITVCLKL